MAKRHVYRQTGDYLGEDDIERLEDDYGRSGAGEGSRRRRAVDRVGFGRPAAGLTRR